MEEGQGEAELGVQGHGGDEQGARRFSTRAAFFIVIYCWLFSCSLMNSVVSIFRVEDTGRHFSDVVNDWLWMVVAFLVLVVHSAVASMPSEQPFRFLMLCARGVLTASAVMQTSTFWAWCPLV